jgi:GTP-binding protein
VSRPGALVALVGRPNVGKSTLFNRMLGSRQAIVAEAPGTTRDRLYAEAEWAGRRFHVVDTGGLDLGSGEIALRVRNQALVAIEEADLVVFVVDAADGVTAADQAVADLLRRGGKPIVLAANKADAESRGWNASEFWALGVGQPYSVSAVHGRGVGDLLDAIVASMPPMDPSEGSDDAQDALRVAIVGRPNVGKSSLLNAVLGRQRTIVDPQAGTTRDSIDERVRFQGHDYVLVDTAGIRRRGRVEPGIEKYAVLRATRAIERCHVAALLLDAVDGVTAQDGHVGAICNEAGCGAMIVVNKWDLVEKDTSTEAKFVEQVRAQLAFLDYAPILTVSALTGQRTGRVLPLASEIQEFRTLRVPTAELNRLVEDLRARHDFRRKGKELKIKYATQAGTQPPTFVFFVNDRALVHFSFERFVQNQLRERYAFRGTPVRLVFRDSSGDKRPR